MRGIPRADDVRLGSRPPSWSARGRHDEASCPGRPRHAGASTYQRRALVRRTPQHSAKVDWPSRCVIRPKAGVIDPAAPIVIRGDCNIAPTDDAVPEHRRRPRSTPHDAYHRMGAAHPGTRLHLLGYAAVFRRNRDAHDYPRLFRLVTARVMDARSYAIGADLHAGGVR